MNFSVYQKDGPSDLLLTQWWTRIIVEENEKPRAFAHSMVSSLYSFLAFFQPPNELVFKSDDKLALWFAAWLEPTLSGAFFGLWCHPERRRTKSELQAVEEAIQYGLSKYPVLLGVTRRENLLDAHRRLGYNVLGKVPFIFDGEDAWAVFITKEMFDGREVHLVRRPRKEGQWEEEVKVADQAAVDHLRSSELLRDSS